MIFLRILAVTLALPWTIAFGLVRLLIAGVRLPWRIAAKSADVMYCPDGHPNPVMGRWTCSCGAEYLGHAFAACPICDLPAGWLHCEQCGLALRSPWKNDS